VRRLAPKVRSLLTLWLKWRSRDSHSHANSSEWRTEYICTQHPMASDSSSSSSSSWEENGEEPPFVPRHLCQVVPFEMMKHHLSKEWCVGFLKSLPRDQRSAVRAARSSVDSRNNPKTGSRSDSPASQPIDAFFRSAKFFCRSLEESHAMRTGCGRCPTSASARPSYRNLIPGIIFQSSADWKT